MLCSNHIQTDVESTILSLTIDDEPVCHEIVNPAPFEIVQIAFIDEELTHKFVFQHHLIQGLLDGLMCCASDVTYEVNNDELEIAVIGDQVFV